MSKLTDEQIDRIYTGVRMVHPHIDADVFARAIEAAATEPLLQRIAELEANEKALLAQVQGLTKWREKIIKASEQAYGESAIRYKFSLTKSGKVMNTFPKEIDGRWFALVPAEDDGHIGHIARIAELERQLEEARKDAERYRWIRKQHWSENILGVVVRPKDQTKLGSMLPSMELLDDTIDHMSSEGAAMQKGQQ